MTRANETMAGKAGLTKVLIMVGGRWHPWELFGEVIANVLASRGGCEVTVTEDREAFCDLAGFDVVMIYTQGGNLTAGQEKGLMDFVSAGGGLVGVHGATASFKENAGYMEMIGTKFVGHGESAEIAIEHSDDYEDITPRLAKTWTIYNELYNLEVQTDAPLRAFQFGWWEAERKMLGYVRNYGDGRVFYTALGHGGPAINHPEFQDLLLKAVRYVTFKKETPLRWGIVGYGPACSMGAHHAENIALTANIELVAVCDKDPARIEVAKGEQGESLQYFTDIQDLIDAKCCDGVTVIVPHHVHAAVTVPLLQAGLHVISEKPFAITPDECDQMIAAADASGAALSVYHSRHWDADMWTIRQLVEEGLVGEVFAVEHNMCSFDRPWGEWRGHKPLSGGILYDMGAHGFEKMFQLVPRFDDEGKPINQKALLSGNFLKKIWFDTTNEDFGRAYVKFDTGLELTLLQSNISAADRPSFIVSGTEGSIATAPDGLEVKRFVHQQIRTTHVPYVTGLTWQSYYRNFVDHVLAGVPLIITPQLAKATIQCIHGCEVAARENRLVEVELDF